METPSPSNPNLASNVSSESLSEKYKDEISTLPQENNWSTFPSSQPLCLYQGFWFYPFFLKGAMYARDHFQAQPNDIFLCSSMKTGSTWLKALCFSIATRTQFDIMSSSPLRTSVPHDCIPFLESGENCSIASGASRSLLFATHLPFSCLPKSITDSGCKIVYLWRDAKDTFVSLWHFLRNGLESYKKYLGDGDILRIEEAFELFCKGISSYGPYWDHVFGYWKASLERPDKILFLRYEDMKKDAEACAKKLAEFFGCPFSLEEERDGIIQRIVNFCSFESLSNLEVNKTGKHVKKDAQAQNSTYFRKGKVGDWRNYLTDEMGMRLDDIMEKKFSGSGMTINISSPREY